MTLFDAVLSAAISETHRKLNAHCSECAFVCEIDWNAGRTELSGHCPIGDVYLVNSKGGHSLNQKRGCSGFDQSSAADQAERVQKKILEAEAVLEAFLHPHSSQLSPSSQVTSENSSMRGAGSLEQQSTVDKNLEVENRQSTVRRSPGQSKSSSFSDRGAAGRASRANSQGPETE